MKNQKPPALRVLVFRLPPANYRNLSALDFSFPSALPHLVITCMLEAMFFFYASRFKK
jgi:hypothetical protein